MYLFDLYVWIKKTIYRNSMLVGVQKSFFNYWKIFQNFFHVDLSNILLQKLQNFRAKTVMGFEI